VAIYFPRTLKAYKVGAFNERYPVEVPAQMASWVQFLDTFHGTAATTVTTAPVINVLNVYPPDQVASIYQPAVVTLDISGRDILQVNYAVSQVQADGQRVVLDFDYFVSRTTTPTGTNIINWADGVTTRTFTWEAEVPLLSDGTTTTYALLIPNRDNPEIAIVNGEYTPTNGKPIEAQLVFDLNSRQATGLWGLNETESGAVQPFQIEFQDGETFRPLWLTLDQNNDLASTSFGETLILNAAQPITFEKVPAPSGSYSISFVAENVTGEKTLSEATIQVNNDGLDPALRGYTDVTYGVNFRYPSNWIRPRFTPDGKRLFTADLTTNTVMTLFPYTDVATAEETADAVQASWAALPDLQVTDRRAVEVNSLPAFVIDYTYTFEGQPRAGAVIAIFVPSQNVGYGFDLDAPADNPGPAQQALAALIESINFFAPGEVIGDSSWHTVSPGGGLVSFQVPTSWTEEQDGGFTLYRPLDRQDVFIALGVAAASGQTKEQLAQFYVQQLQSNEQNLQVLAEQPYYVGNQEWYLVVFTYDKAGVAQAGAFFATTVGGQDYIFWMEAPDAEFDQIYADTFGVSVDSFAFSG
jgi:hypothetical protein